MDQKKEKEHKPKKEKEIHPPVTTEEACGPNEYWDASLGRCVPDVGPQPE